MVARTAAPSGAPVSADRPDAMSTARTGAPQALMAAITAAATPATGALSPVPKSASTTAAARASRRARASTSAGVASARTAPRARRHAASMRAASPRTSSGRAASQTSTGTRARRRWRATTKPSPPLLPRPHTTTTGPRGRPRRARSTRAAPPPARSIRTGPGVPCSMVQRSSARISSAVTTINISVPSCYALARAIDGAAHPGRVPHDIEAALGGELLAPLRHEARVGGADTEREGDDRVGHRHLEVQLDAEPSAQFLDVALLDMAPVLAQVHGDAVGARRLGHQRRLDGVRVVDPARLPEGGDVVDIAAEMEHGSAQSQVELVPLHEPLQQLAPSLQPPPAGMQHVSCPSRA